MSVRQDEAYGFRGARKKTLPVTFRLPEDLVRELKEEAESADVTVGTLGREVLSRYVSWDTNTKKLRLVPTTRGFVKDVLGYLSDSALKDVASGSGKHEMLGLILMIKGNLTTDSFVSVFKEWLRSCGMTVRFERTSGYHFVISHDMGGKWSLYMAHLATATSAELPNRLSVYYEVRDNTLSLRLTPEKGSLVRTGTGLRHF
ncbi:MAG: hypothetical protein OK422_00380 [Thaumarchaeota archaeon]|nr:hypothetical protein [Nitrososphaerota archaeon]